MRKLSLPQIAANRRCVAALLALLCCCQGCGTGAYEERMNQRIKQLRAGGGVSSGAGLYVAGQVGKTPLWIRVPDAFTQGLEPGAIVNGKPVSAGRVQPPVTVPGLKATWEATADHDGKKLPYYCYLAVSEKDPKGPIQQQIQQLYQGQEVAWKDVTDTAGRKWKRFRADLEQDWIPLDRSNNETKRVTLNGMLQFDCRQEGGQWMVVGWRVPRPIESAAKLDRVMGPALGSLESR